MERSVERDVKAILVKVKPAPAPRPRAKRSASGPVAKTSSRPASTVALLARKLGLRLGDQSALTVRRLRRGKGYRFIRDDGKPVREQNLIARFHALAVPPAYEEVRYALDPALHLQAVGRDAAGRLQYRYHADWEQVRETRKASRLATLVEALPTIRRSTAQHLSGEIATREFALAAVIELIARTATAR